MSADKMRPISGIWDVNWRWGDLTLRNSSGKTYKQRYILLAGFHLFSSRDSPARGRRAAWIPIPAVSEGQGGVKTWTSSRVNRRATDNAFLLSLLMHIKRNLASDCDNANLQMGPFQIKASVQIVFGNWITTDLATLCYLHPLVYFSITSLATQPLAWRMRMSGLKCSLTSFVGKKKRNT